MAARFLVRFDDACPTLRWETWEPVEAILDRHGVRPIVAVVPDNQDPALVTGPARADFWERARAWKARGWTIGLHGHRHVYDSPHAGLLGLRPRSEFAGLPEDVQASRLDAGLAILRREGLEPDLWIAPGHSFDATTVRLLQARGLGVISDGLSSRVVRHLGSTWVPQQLFRFRDADRGVFTVCYHTNEFRAADLARFEADVERYRDRITDLVSVLREEPPPLGPRDRLEAALRRARLRSLHALWELRRAAAARR